MMKEDSILKMIGFTVVIVVFLAYILYRFALFYLPLRVWLAPYMWQLLHPLGKEQPYLVAVTSGIDPNRPYNINTISGNRATIYGQQKQQLAYGYRFRCLVIGCDYTDTRDLQLDGGMSDGYRVSRFWRDRMKVNVDNRNVWALCADDNFTPWVSAIQIPACKWFVDDLRPGDRRFLHYSGHGVPLPSEDGSGNIERCLVPIDSETPGRPTLSDLDLFEYIVRPHINTDAFTFVFFDCCYSGDQMCLRYQWEADPLTGQIIAYKNKKYGDFHPEIQSKVNIVCLGAARTDEKAAEVYSYETDYTRPIGKSDLKNQFQYYGAVTDAFYDKLDRDIDPVTSFPKTTWRQMLNYLSDELQREHKARNNPGIAQSPQLSSSRVIDLDAPLINFEFLDSTTEEERRLQRRPLRDYYNRL
jgi:hypothetical protein